MTNNKKIKNPLEAFFALGDKVTKGDRVRKAQFDYYMLWIMFVAFSSILISNFISFLALVETSFMESLKYLGWAFVMLAVLWFQYQGLRAAYFLKKQMEDSKLVKIEPLKEESIEEMMEGFKKE
jgi:hypothetical protein